MFRKYFLDLMICDKIMEAVGAKKKQIASLDVLRPGKHGGQITAAPQGLSDDMTAAMIAFLPRLDFTRVDQELIFRMIDGHSFT